MIYAIIAIPMAIELNIPSTITPVLRSMQKQHFGKMIFPYDPLPILDNETYDNWNHLKLTLFLTFVDKINKCFLHR